MKKKRISDSKLSPKNPKLPPKNPTLPPKDPKLSSKNSELSPLNSALSSKLAAVNQNDLTARGSCDATALTLGGLSVYVGWEAFRNLFTTPDRTLCYTLVAIGFVIALYRSNWRGDLTRTRFRIAIACSALASLMICAGIAFANPRCSQFALISMAIGWGAFRIRGEAISQSVFLGGVLCIPVVIDLFEYLGFFEWIEPTTVSITSLLADAASLPHVVSEGKILLNQGIADHFASIGTIDSLVGLFGVSMFCILACRRSLLVSAANLGSLVFVWVSVRVAVWLILLSLTSRHQAWSPWTVEVTWFGFLVGAALVVSLDQFFDTVFKPIPFGLFNTESPLVAFVWNWLCGLPRIVLRVPTDHKIALRWRTLVKLAGKKPSFQTDWDWMKLHFFALLFHPIAALGSTIDLARGWSSSRHWMRFFANSTSLILLISFYGALVFSMFGRKDDQAKLFSKESLEICSTRTLEIAFERQTEREFSKTIGAVERDVLSTPGEPLPEDSLRYLELLSRRIVAISPNDQITKYRLGLIASQNGRPEQAELEMREITGSKFGDFPPANAWLAKTLAIKKSMGGEVAKTDLMDHMEKASKWKDADFRMLLLYARMLEEQGDNKKALEIVKQVAAAKPEVILELAKLCLRIGDDEGRIAAANQAENYFIAKINFPTEVESDRLSVADARVLTNRLEAAAEVLTEGLRQNLGGPRTVRQLSEIQRLLYRRSVKKNADGTLAVKLDLLEAMAETDGTNPRVSTEIAELLSLEVKPTKKLMDVLKNQITLGIADVPALLIMGEKFFIAGNFSEAQKYWELAVAKEPDNFAALNNLASCLIAISSSNVERALELVSRAATNAPNNANILDTWGEVLALADRHQEAINKFELAIRNEAGRIDIRRKLLASYKALKMTEMAELQSKVIVELEQSNATTTPEVK